MPTTVEQIATALTAWGRCEVLRTLAGGHRNTVVLARRDAELLVAKTSRRQTAAIEWLVEVQRTAQGVGLLVPDLIPSLNGALQVGGITVERWA